MVAFAQVPCRGESRDLSLRGVSRKSKRQTGSEPRQHNLTARLPEANASHSLLNLNTWSVGWSVGWSVALSSLWDSPDFGCRYSAIIREEQGY